MSKIVHTMGSQVEFSNAYTTAEIEIRERCAANLSLVLVEPAHDLNLTCQYLMDGNGSDACPSADSY